MSKPKASKRKPIHDNNQPDEIDNVKSSVIVTRSKTQEKLLKKEMNGDKSDENGFSELSWDEDEVVNDIQARKSGSGEYEAHFRRRNQQKRNVSSDSERLDSSPSLSHDPLQNVKFESIKNNLKQANKTSKSNRSPAFETSNNTYSSSSNNSCCKYLWLIICLAGLVFAGYLYGFVSESNEDFNVLKCEKKDVVCITDNVKRTLKSMKAKYTNQDNNLWSDVFLGIKNIIHDPKKPSIIVLLGDKSAPLKCLAVLLGNVSSNALNSGLLQLAPENFQNDIGSVITSVRSSIKDKKAVIVWDLLNINEEALKAFHNLCDRINPLIEEVIYIITIIADDYDKKMEPLEFVEKKLYTKLSGKIKEDTIQPLITRITDGPIIRIKPEPDLIDCLLPKVSK